MKLKTIEENPDPEIGEPVNVGDYADGENGPSKTEGKICLKDHV